ncbi:ThuA domain-containing protein [Seonamhaeicola marinus]|uniref:ThuA domain-containing protein n=1 Tax=Seonamhaeicola marinus TaxID=1912246 RepID=A0A5D0HKL4_9FLAO|nr:ThuA domain-containing protein [Seonamhaeicola marinus]TYA69842.1 ThuA domain-containing protein [Seonamhaeicola marinus]
MNNKKSNQSLLAIKKTLFFIPMLLILVAVQSSFAQNDTNVLVVRGGHPYDTPDFENMCESLEGIKVDLVLDAHFKSMKLDKIKDSYDAILFLNQNKYYEESKGTKEKYVNLTNAGVGMVFLHFTLSSQPNWDEYHEIIGGKWFLGKFTPEKSKRSTYFIDRKVDIKVADKKHPVTKGLKDFTLTDVFYGNIYLRDGVHVLLDSDNEDLAPIAWTQKYNNSKVVYIIPGYSKKAFGNPSYKKLVANALTYVGK